MWLFVVLLIFGLDFVWWFVLVGWGWLLFCGNCVYSVFYYCVGWSCLLLLCGLGVWFWCWLCWDWFWLCLVFGWLLFFCWVVVLCLVLGCLWYSVLWFWLYVVWFGYVYWLVCWCCVLFVYSCWGRWYCLCDSWFGWCYGVWLLWFGWLVCFLGCGWLCLWFG